MSSSLQTILLKRSSVANKQPQTTDLQLGELALNTHDGRLFWKYNSGSLDIISEAVTKAYTQATYVAQNPTISPGTATKISYSSNGLVIGGTTLTVSDLPSIPWSQITAGSTPNTLNGYGISDAQPALGFIPVQQGYGTYPSSNVVYVGFNNNTNQLTVKVNSGDFGSTWPINISGTSGSSIPAGAVMYFALQSPYVAPPGWLLANGAALNISTYSNLYAALGTQFNVSGTASTQFNVPDLRGVFIRGYDNGAGLDPGRVFGSYQADMFASHNHLTPTTNGVAQSPPREVAGNSGDGYDYVDSAGPSAPVSTTGGVETRPKNVALLACIKY